jgi:predicted ester cyclase
MSAEENKAVVRRYYEDIWNEGDLTAIEECIGPEGLAHFDGEEHVNRDHWRDVITRWRRAFPDIHHVVDHLIAEGDIAAANIRFTGTHRDVYQIGNWEPWAPTGKSVNVKEANFFRLAGGKVVEFWAIWDTTTFARQLGVDLPQAGTTT